VMRRSMLILLLLLFAAPALAVDGVLEINQTCAVKTGCFTGDTTGYPVTIDGSAGRSYRLTSDLAISTVNTTGILVTTSNVSVDLNGFEIAGPVVCTGQGSGISCTPNTGTGSGVETAPGMDGASVKNGSVRGFGSSGVWLKGQGNSATDLRVSGNLLYGIYVDDHSLVSGNNASRNMGTGIRAQERAVVSGNAASKNGGDGISAAEGSSVSGNVVGDNGGDGISAGIGLLISGNIAHQNRGDGIVAYWSSFVSGNTLIENSGYGLHAYHGSLYRENIMVDNPAGGVAGSGENIGVNLGGNYCAGDNVTLSTCP
jgi:hypothetical protein